MKTSSSTLEMIKGLLLKANEQLNSQRKVATESEALRVKLDGQMRLLQGAYDICAASFAQDTELSDAQMNSLPLDVQKALGYSKNKPGDPALSPAVAPLPAK
jgi:hypothetical protein